VREQKSSCEPSACDAHSHVNASRLSVGLRSYGSRRESPIMDRAAEIESDSSPRQLVQGSDVDIAPLAGIAAAFGRWWLGRIGAITDDLVKRPASEIRQLTLHSLDIFPQRVGR
jgi:hypothetical protein